MHQGPISVPSLLHAVEIPANQKRRDHHPELSALLCGQEGSGCGAPGEGATADPEDVSGFHHEADGVEGVPQLLCHSREAGGQETGEEAVGDATGSQYRRHHRPLPQVCFALVINKLFITAILRCECFIIERYIMSKMLPYI